MPEMDTERALRLEQFSQWFIAVVGGVGFFLISIKEPWGFVLTLVTQPFWFVSTWKKKQWGMFFLTGLYTVSCAIAIDGWFFNSYYRKLLVGL